jgi:hypothetical protein
VTELFRGLALALSCTGLLLSACSDDSDGSADDTERDPTTSAPAQEPPVQGGAVEERLLVLASAATPDEEDALRTIADGVSTDHPQLNLGESLLISPVECWPSSELTQSLPDGTYVLVVVGTDREIEELATQLPHDLGPLTATRVCVD